MNCPNCNNEVPDNKKFCGHCGHQLHDPTAPDDFDEDAPTIGVVGEFDEDASTVGEVSKIDNVEPEISKGNVTTQSIEQEVTSTHSEVNLTANKFPWVELLIISLGSGLTFLLVRGIRSFLYTPTVGWSPQAEYVFLICWFGVGLFLGIAIKRLDSNFHWKNVAILSLIWTFGWYLERIFWDMSFDFDFDTLLYYINAWVVLGMATTLYLKVNWQPGIQIKQFLIISVGWILVSTQIFGDWSISGLRNFASIIESILVVTLSAGVMLWQINKVLPRSTN